MRKCFCGRPVFGTDKDTGIGYCSSHQWKRTDKKKKTPHIMEKEKKEPIEFSFGYRDQTSMFLDLWHDAYVPGKGIICPFTGESLYRFKGTTYFFNCFSHVLSKKNYSFWKLNPYNIRIVHPSFHSLTHFGTFADRKLHPTWNFDLWDQEVERLKIEYQQFKKENLLP